ncbi:MAG: hypothetical protein P8L49_09375 [Opitutaceae bacterium]|nr:hypothetical protein [Opitutaceae bacterium]
MYSPLLFSFLLLANIIIADDGTAPDNIQGQSFLSILKESKTQVRQLVFSEHDWHVYKNHERMVRFGDFVYVKKLPETRLRIRYSISCRAGAMKSPRRRKEDRSSIAGICEVLPRRRIVPFEQGSESANELGGKS